MNCVDFSPLKKIIKNELEADIACGDITTESIIPSDIKASAVIQAQESGVICGISVAREVFLSKNNKIRFKALVEDGARVKKGQIIAGLTGSARDILSCERTALNFLSFLSGISTRTDMFVRKVKPYKAKILDTRKTIAGLRALEKYAVRVAGGYNHRKRLDQMVLVKDNHIAVVRRSYASFRAYSHFFSLKELIFQVRKKIPK
ncbi:MAG: nicotinate-nucleotide diphosphorylase (carboxylating), partial [Candidatus Omnitrophica bacterium]|nr:nicotinate-nucleotide diphosphorylase (carboxylating) [Candidatus Omnitrophota bacterium]